MNELNLFPLTDARARTHTPMTTYEKVEKAIRLISSLGKHRTWEIAYSGGKDSDVLLWLVRQAGISYEAVYKCTTIDPPGTISHVLANQVTILRPQITFLQLVEKKGLPSMFHRYCCSYLKEYYHAPYVMTGVRAVESNKRKERYKEPTSCRVWSKKKTAEIATPLCNFTDRDIKTIVNDNNIQCHPLYYDENGIFHVERRLGCVGCPLKSDRGRADFIKYPKLFRQIVKRYLNYCNRIPQKKDPYLYIVESIFYSNHGKDKYNQTYNGLFPAPNPKQFLEDYFKIELP